MQAMRLRWLARTRWKLGLGMLLLSTIVVPWLAPSGVQPIARAQSSDSEPVPVFFPEFRRIKLGDQLALRGDTDTIAGDEWALRLADNDAVDGLYAGAAWYTARQPVNNRFRTTFQFRISDSIGGRADGFAFVIQNTSTTTNTLGNPGCGVGYGGITPSIVIEFDTFRNSSANGLCAENNDPVRDHIGIQLNGSPRHTTATSLGTGMLAQNLVAGRVYTATIHYEEQVLSVELNNTPVVSVNNVDIAQRIGGDTAWIGFVAGTGAHRQNHDILNWHFAANWGLRCVDFDFTRESYSFTGVAGGWIGAPILANPFEGWGGDGRVVIDRGVQYYTSHDLFEETTGMDPALLELIEDTAAPAPIHEVRIHYTRTVPNTPLIGTFEMTLADDGASPVTNSSTSATDQEYTENGEERYIRRIPIRPSDLVRAVHPAGVRVSLDSQDATEHIRIKKLGLCIEAGPQPRPLVMPAGARQACITLLANLRSRRQPYGPATVTPADPAQPEVQFSTTISLETYPEYFQIRHMDGYLAPLTYTDANTPSGHALVPCVFEQNDEIYRVPDSGTGGAPIVRFAAVGADPLKREWLRLLNYAGYYALGQENWCYPGDNAFALHLAAWGEPSRSHSSAPLLYGPGYNVPPPAFACDTGLANGSDSGPCGSFVGSLYRAMGYFNVDAFSDPQQVGRLRGLYYGVLAYTNILPTIDPGDSLAQRPFVRVNGAITATYTPLPINSFSAIRVYARDAAGQRPLGVAGVDPINTPWSVCNEDNEDYDPALCNALNRVSGHWNRPIDRTNDIEYSPLWIQRPANSPTSQDIWRAIRPGDISITVIDKEGGGRQYPHVQIVVGWGPPAWDYSLAAARRGENLYTTYAALSADQQASYVPYVADRYRTPGDGIVPRPFNLAMMHTSTDFWVANYSQP